MQYLRYLNASWRYEEKKIKPYSKCKDDKEFWNQYYERPVTDEEIEEIRHNIVKLGKTLLRIHKEKKKDN